MLSHLFGIVCILEVNKGKAPGAPRLLVTHNADVRQGAVFGEDIPQIPLCGVQAQAKHSQAGVGVGISLQLERRQGQVAEQAFIIKWTDR